MKNKCSFCLLAKNLIESNESSNVSLRKNSREATDIRAIGYHRINLLFDVLSF